MDTLIGLDTCNGRIGATGMCLGGHLAFRCAFDKRIRAAVCYFATDIHSHSLGAGKNDDSLQRVKDIKGELVMVRFLLSCYPTSGSFHLDGSDRFLLYLDFRQKGHSRPIRWPRSHPVSYTHLTLPTKRIV